jgi:hypothetical protein
MNEGSDLSSPLEKLNRSSAAGCAGSARNQEAGIRHSANSKSFLPNLDVE